MIFFYYGENSWLAKNKIDAIAKKFKSEIDPGGHNILHLDGEAIKADDFFQAISVTGFLASKRLIIIKNIFSNKKLASWQDALLNFLQKQNDSPEENYLIFWETNKPDARLKLYKKLKTFKYVEEFAKLSSSQLEIWVKKQCQKNKKNISPQAIRLLIAYVGNDLWALSQEINKLTNYSQTDIEENTVKELVNAKLDENIFNFIDALGNQDKALALQLLNEQMNSGANPQYLLSMIIRQYRLLLKAKLITKQADYPGALAQALKIQPWLAEKTFKQTRNYSLEQLKNIYQQLLILDTKLKTSSLDPQLLFVKIIGQI